MNLFRTPFLFFSGWALGFFSVGFFASLSFPYSEFPLIPIMIALSLVFRVRAHMFWFLLTLVATTDLYRTTGFGIGILSFAILIIVGFKVTSELFTHRSLMGCVVISLMVGCLWVLCIEVFGWVSSLFGGVSIDISFTSILLSLAIQGGGTGIFVGSGRSPTVVTTRFI
jgi:hypothetical protein